MRSSKTAEGRGVTRSWGQYCRVGLGQRYSGL